MFREETNTNIEEIKWIFHLYDYNLDKLNLETQEEMGDDESHGGEFSVQ